MSILFLLKIAYANNISRKSSFIFLAGLHIAMVGISTCLLLPAVRYELSLSKTKTKVNKSNNETEEEHEGFITENGNNEKSSGICNYETYRKQSRHYISKHMHVYTSEAIKTGIRDFAGYILQLALCRVAALKSLPVHRP